MNATVDLCLGAVFVLFYAGGRFNTPATNRSSTTAIRYFLGLFCYCMVGLLGYVSVIKFPHLLTFLLQGDTAVIPPWAQQLSSPLFAALLLTVLLPRLPLLSDIDGWIRKELQEMAAIPFEVRRLCAELRDGRLHVSQELEAEVIRKLEKRGINRKNISFEADDTPAYLCTRIGVLLVKVQDWESDRKMSGYMGALPGELDQLSKRYDQLLLKAKMYFRLQNEDIEGYTTRTHEAMIRYHEDFGEQLTQLHGCVLDFISRGVLHAELTDAARQQRLHQMGFHVEWRRAAFTFNQATFIFGLLLLVMVGSMIVFSNAGSGVTFGVRLTRLVLRGIIYCIAAACAVLPKEHWAFARHRPGEFRPVGSYILSGLMAVVFGQALTFLFNASMMASLTAAAQRFLVSYPWMLTTFATSVILCILIDNEQSTRCTRMQQRVLEAITQAAVMAGAAYLARLWLLDRIANAVSLPPNFHAPNPGSMITTAAGIGLVLGFCIPTWFREAPRSHADPEQPAPALNLAAAAPR